MLQHVIIKSKIENLKYEKVFQHRNVSLYYIHKQSFAWLTSKLSTTKHIICGLKRVTTTSMLQQHVIIKSKIKKFKVGKKKLFYTILKSKSTQNIFTKTITQQFILPK